MNKDTVTGIMGALVLVAAMTGVFFYERGQFHEYPVSWVSGEQNVTQTPGGTLDHGDSRDHRFTVAHPEALVAQVTVELHWDDPPEDTFRLEVAHENGTVNRSQESGGHLILAIPVQDAPAEVTYGDRSQDGAITQAWRSLEEDQVRAGFGVWSVTVTLVDAMRANEIPVMDDEAGENDYHLTFTVDHWIPVVQADP